MALDKDVLGTAMKTAADAFNEVYISPADLDAQRLQYWKNIAEAIISHFKSNGVLNVPGIGLNAGSVAVSGASVTGTIT